MSARKPLDERCDGGIFCPVDGHLIRTGRGFQHIGLTLGQLKTLYDRQRAGRPGVPEEQS